MSSRVNVWYSTPWVATAFVSRSSIARTRHRPAMGETHAVIIAAEKIAAKLNGIADVKAVTVETYERAKELVGSRKHVWCWDPHTPESADQSIPYLVAIALRDGP